MIINIRAAKITAFLLLAFQTPISSAASWAYLTEDDESRYYIDNDSVSVAHIGFSSYTQSWFRRELKSPKMRGKKRYDSMDSLHFNACEEREFSVRYAIYRNGNKTVSQGTFESLSFYPTPPGTIAEILFNAACSRRR